MKPSRILVYVLKIPFSLVTNRLFLKFALSAGLLAYVVKKNGIDIDNILFAMKNWNILAVAFILLFVDIFLITARWHLVIASQRIRIRFLKLLKLNFIGEFFNTFLPGSFMGDLVKAYYLVKGVDSGKGILASTILVERFVGLFCYFAFIVFAMIADLRHVMDNNFYFPALITAIAVLILMVACTISFKRLIHFLEGISMLQKYPSWKKLTGSCRNIADNFRISKKILALACVISIISSANYTLLSLFLIKSLLILNISFVQLAYVFSIGSVLTAVPIAILPASIGVGHFVYMILFNQLQQTVTSSGGDFFSMKVMIVFVFSIIGMYYYLTAGDNKSKAFEIQFPS